MALESDSCYPFFVPPPFPPFTSSNDERLLEEDYQPISDLELHFNTLFMLESEKGRNYHNKDHRFDPNPKNTDISHLTLLDDSTNKHKKIWNEKESNLSSHYFSGLDNNQITKSFSDKNGQKSCNIRSDSFTMSELSTCSYTTTNNNLHSSLSDYGSLKSNSLEEPDWKYYSDVNCTKLDDRYNWLDEKCENKEDDVFFDSNFTGRLTPDSISDEILGISHKTPLPPLETAFSKHFGRFSERDASIPQNGITCNNLDLYITTPQMKPLSIDNLDGYCYPNNILFPNEANNKNDTDKTTDYSELLHEFGCSSSKKFNCLNDDTKCDNIDEKLSFFDEKKIANNLIEDLDSLSYFKQDDDNLIGFEDYCEQKESSFEIHDERDILSTSLEDGGLEAESQKDERICFWRDCEMHFPTQTTLVEHIEKVHVNTYKGEEFSCLWCACARETRPFNARYKLLIHMRVHSGHKPNKCGFPGCGKAFSRLENLKIHRRSHTGERPYRCQAPRCSKAFSNSSDRAKHQRTHFNARPYACQIEGCVKRYTDPSSLRKHVKNHFSPTSRLTNKIILQQDSRKNTKYTQETTQKNPQNLKNSKLVTIAVQQKIKMDKIANNTKTDTSSLKTFLGLRSSKRLNNAEEERRNENKHFKLTEDDSNINNEQDERLNFLDISQSNRHPFTNNIICSDFGVAHNVNIHEREKGNKSNINDKYNSFNSVFDHDDTEFDQYVQEQFNIGYFEESFS